MCILHCRFLMNMFWTIFRRVQIDHEGAGKIQGVFWGLTTLSKRVNSSKIKQETVNDRRFYGQGPLKFVNRTWRIKIWHLNTYISDKLYIMG